VEQEAFIARVLPLFGLSLIFAAMGAGVGIILLPSLVSNPISFGIIFIIEFVLLLMAYATKRKFPINIIIFALVTFFSGITIAPILITANYIGGLSIIAEAFGLAGLVTIGLSVYVVFSGADFSFLRGFLFMATLGLVLASLVGIFVHNDFFYIAVDYAAVLIFSLWILYDMSSILKHYSEDEYVSATLQLYFDFLNLFIRILVLLMRSRQRD
jgi:FtsH-binding integral membrane protein